MKVFLGVFSYTNSYEDWKAGAKRWEQQSRTYELRAPLLLVNRIGKFPPPAREKYTRVYFCFFPSAYLFHLTLLILGLFQDNRTVGLLSFSPARQNSHNICIEGLKLPSKW